MSDASTSRSPGTDFIRQIVTAHVDEGRYPEVVTRFPPEPNGYLHIGHAKSICLNFGIAREFGGRCHLRFDDTNPETEREEYVTSIQDDVRWLGFDWGPHLYFASDYFERLYECAVVLIEKGLAYVDSSSEEEIREARGTVTRPGRSTAFRDRSVAENLDLFRRMREGEFPNGAHVLRGRIDLASPNMIMRDPVFYRIRHASHYRTGDDWCIYPLYDYAHCLEDAFEGISHSLCTLEFENNREIYDWILDNVGFVEPRTHQYEFNRLNLEYTVLSKRKLIRLVEEGHVAGWSDPRMPTIAGIRRRGVPPEALRAFANDTGVVKSDSRVDMAKLEFSVRDTLNATAPRVMAVLEPLKVVLTNYPEHESEELDAPYFPHDVPREGSRMVPFSRELWIERSDFSQDPPKGFRRLVPGGEVRLRYGYVIRCDEVVRDESGAPVELRCSYDPATAGGGSGGRTGLGTIHWVSAGHAVDAEVRLVDRLFVAADPNDVADDGDFTAHLNPDSLEVIRGAKVEPSVANDEPSTRYQFERTGYFWRDPEADGTGLVFLRIVTLKDSWGRRLSAEAGRVDLTAGEARLTVNPAEARGVDIASPDASPQGPRVSAERQEARAADPALAAHMERYVDDLGLTPEDADVITGSRASVAFFEAAVEVAGDAPSVAAWMVNDLRGVLGGRTVAELPFGGPELGRLIALVLEGTLSRRAAKDVLAAMAEKGGDPAEITRALGLEKIEDRGALEEAVDRTLAGWPEKVAEYRAGRHNLMGLFVGEVMKQTRGAADPKAVKAMLAERLGGGS
jgi:glutaminyl-tRNA synthetase